MRMIQEDIWMKSHLNHEFVTLGLANQDLDTMKLISNAALNDNVVY